VPSLRDINNKRGGFGGVLFYIQIVFPPITPGESFEIMIEGPRKGHTRAQGRAVMAATTQTRLQEAEQGQSYKVKKPARDLTVVNWVPQFLLGVKTFTASVMAACLHFL